MILVTKSGISRRGFIGMEVKGIGVSLRADIISLLLAFDAVPVSLSILRLKKRGELILCPQREEIDLVSIRCYLCVVVDLRDFFLVLKEFWIVGRNVSGKDDRLFVFNLVYLA